MCDLFVCRALHDQWTQGCLTMQLPLLMSEVHAHAASESWNDNNDLQVHVYIKSTAISDKWDVSWCSNILT